MNGLPLLLAAALAASAACLPGARPSEQSALSTEKRPLVLVVHGRGYLARDSATFRREALTALRSGAFRAFGDSILRSDDVRLVWYADLMDVRRRDLSSSGTCETQSSSSPSASPASFIQALAMIASSLLEAADEDSGQTEVRGLAGDLRFFGDRRTRCAAESRVAAALAQARDDGRPVVIVAHSLGALVTWGHLQHRENDTSRQLPTVRRLVTLGSPIGATELRQLLLGDDAPLRLPRGVDAWVNAVNEADPFASRLIVTDSVSGRVRTIPGVTDVMTTRAADDAHEIRAYLRDPATAKAIVSAWCDAMEKRDRPAACLSS